MSFILIVNAFENSANGSKKYRNFKNVIKKSFSKCMLLPKEPTYFECTLNELSKFVFDPHLSGFPDLSGVRRFDAIDFIFIDGDSNILPWDESARNLLLLLRMAIVTKKCTLACGPAMLAVAYLSRMKLEIENHERLKEGNEMRLIAYDSGDYYKRNVEKKKELWRLKKAGNAGLILSSESQHQFNNGIKIGKGQTNDFREDLECHIVKKYIGHWLFEGLYKDFIVKKSIHRWCVNPRGTTRSERGYSVLCSSIGSPQILKKDNIICLQFHVNTKYPSTIRILENYIMHKTEEILVSPSGRLDAILSYDMSLLPPSSPRILNQNNEKDLKTNGDSQSNRPILSLSHKNILSLKEDQEIPISKHAAKAIHTSRSISNFKWTTKSWKSLQFKRKSLLERYSDFDVRTKDKYSISRLRKSLNSWTIPEKFEDFAFRNNFSKTLDPIQSNFVIGGSQKEQSQLHLKLAENRTDNQFEFPSTANLKKERINEEFEKRHRILKRLHPKLKQEDPIPKAPSYSELKKSGEVFLTKERYLPFEKKIASKESHYGRFVQNEQW